MILPGAYDVEGVCQGLKKQLSETQFQNKKKLNKNKQTNRLGVWLSG